MVRLVLLLALFGIFSVDKLYSQTADSPSKANGKTPNANKAQKVKPRGRPSLVHRSRGTKRRRLTESRRCLTFMSNFSTRSRESIKAHGLICVLITSSASLSAISTAVSIVLLRRSLVSRSIPRPFKKFPPISAQ